VDILKSKSHPVLLTGPSGTGKSIQLLKIDISPLILTSTTSHSQLQSSVESKLDKIRKNLLGPGSGKINIIAIDDTNMPAE
jgi:ABC-type iron transport system FetAB ATPase subunit